MYHSNLPCTYSPGEWGFSEKPQLVGKFEGRVLDGRTNSSEIIGPLRTRYFSAQLQLLNLKKHVSSVEIIVKSNQIQKSPLDERKTLAICARQQIEEKIHLEIRG